MSRVHSIARAGLAGLLAVSLSGCITLLPKTKPAQLYRFSGVEAASEAPAAAPSDPAGRVGVVRARGSFSAGAAGDRIMTVTGAQVAYLAQARWAAPAVTLFDEAVMRAFSQQAGPVRLAARGDPGRAPYSLRLDVERFEAVYDRGGRAAPDVRIEIHAVLVRAADRVVVKDQTLTAHARAADNRVSAIAQAFDQATTQVLKDVVALTNEGAKPVD